MNCKLTLVTTRTHSANHNTTYDRTESSDTIEWRIESRTAYPNEMQRPEQQTEYNQQYNGQTSDRYQTQPIAQTQCQPMQQTYQQQDQSRVPVVTVNQST